MMHAIRRPAHQISQQVLSRNRRPIMLAEMLSPDANSFGALRLLLALLVVVSHSYYLATGIALASEPLHAVSGYTLGQHAVQVFFILSGVLVAQSLSRSDLLTFAAARGLRIFPALIVCVLYTALVIGPVVSTLKFDAYFSSPGLAAYIRDTLLLKTGMAPLPGVFDANPAAGVVNSSVWTLKYEVACYVVLGLAGSITLHLGIARPVGLAVLAAVLAWAVVDRPALAEGNGALDQIQYFTLFFGAGVLAFAMAARLPIHWAGVMLAGAVLIATNGTRWTEVGQAVALGYTALWLATFRFGPLRAFANRNDYSYGVYIFGVPVGQTLLHLSPDLGVGGLIVMSVVISLILAVVSWSLIERPALSLRHRVRSMASRRAAARDPVQKYAATFRQASA